MNHGRFLQQIARLIFIGTLATSCAKEDAGTSKIGEQVMITPTVRSTVDNQESTEGPINENMKLTLYFMRADDPTPSRYGYEAIYDVTKRVAIRTAGSDKQELAFITPGSQYYNMDGTKTLLRGWFPEEDSFEVDPQWGEATVTWTFNGAKDIMVSNFLAGDRADKGINGPDNWFEFKHMLTQLQFYICAETAAAAQAWGNVISIKVKNQANQCIFIPTDNDYKPNSYSLEDCCTFSGEQDLDAYDIPDGGVPIPTKGMEAGEDGLYGAKPAGGIMVAPNSPFTLEVTTKLNDVPTVTKVTVPTPDTHLKSNFAAGESTKVIFNFLTRDIEIMLKNDKWIPVSGKDVDVDLGVNEQ